MDLSHEPCAFVLNHGHNNLLACAISEGEQQENIGCVFYSVGMMSYYSHFFYALMLGLLLCNKHLCIVE